MFLTSFRRCRNLSNMNSWWLLTSFSLDKTENIWSVGFIMNKSCSKSTRMTLNHLLFGSLDKIKLNMAINSFSSIWCWDSEKCGPFFIIWENITNNLSWIFKLSRSIKNFNFFIINVFNAHMINWCGSYNSKNWVIDPSPEDYWLWELDVFKFFFFIKIEDLENVSFSFIWSF